jgi:hypothetical protein
MTRVGIEPTTCGLTYHLGFRRPRPGDGRPMRGSWSGLSLCLHQRRRALGVRHPPSSLYTFRPHPDTVAAWLGVGIAAFPDFDGIRRAISGTVLLLA